MEIASTLIFLVGVVLLFWSLFAVFSPRVLRLGNMWRVAALGGGAVILLMAGTNLDPSNNTPTFEFIGPTLLWATICALAVAIRSLARGRIGRD